eukprot:CAMPEP_0118700216 /NCGR_PEP_ID=MMETSP0800-20121206/16427_1 /TAXON_ID=210618 ORGANISM="Striatella unipunctata, Strain CCMP2910" /NCGR_SAMPLE_ID=MMETSP0800 /ASSEMBLY_ACC=CAM_ASM_000638 /LENGTH=151 /DNA_ID=CAMNT_0006600711 /DNA_START=321 /DNA_END=776 /DNA_ORIENTATION=-
MERCNDVKVQDISKFSVIGDSVQGNRLPPEGTHPISMFWHGCSSPTSVSSEYIAYGASDIHVSFKGLTVTNPILYFSGFDAMLTLTFDNPVCALPGAQQTNEGTIELDQTIVTQDEFGNVGFFGAVQLIGEFKEFHIWRSAYIEMAIAWND